MTQPKGGAAPARAASNNMNNNVFKDKSKPADIRGSNIQAAKGEVYGLRDTKIVGQYLKDN